jgi:copper(I)-binding protein
MNQIRRQHLARTILSLSTLALLAFSPVVHAVDKAAVKPVKAVANVDAPLVKVDNAWVRPTVKGQSGTGGFMNLTASQSLTLVGFSTAAAGESALHEMVMDGSVMRMKAIDALPLPAGQQVSLRPGAGGQHLMLMDLKQPLKEGDELTLTLKLRTAEGKNLTQDVKVPVKVGQMTGGSMGMGASGAHPGMHDMMAH